MIKMDRRLISAVNCADVCITQTGKICVANCSDSTEYNTTVVTLALFEPMLKEPKMVEVTFPVRIGGLGLSDLKLFPFNGGKFILLIFGDDASEFLQLKLFNIERREVRNVGIYEPRLWPDIGVSWLFQVNQTVQDSNELVLIEEDQQVLIINICTFELVRSFQFPNCYKNRGSLFYGAQADWLVSSEHFDAADKFPRMITKVRLSDSELEFQPTIGDPKVRENEGFPQVGDSEEKNWHFGVNLDERLREIYLTTEEKSEEETRRDFSLWRLELPLGKWTLRASFSLDNTVVEHSDVLRMFSYSASTGQLILLWDTADLQLKVVQRWFEPLKLDSLARLALQHL